MMKLGLYFQKIQIHVIMWRHHNINQNLIKIPQIVVPSPVKGIDPLLVIARRSVTPLARCLWDSGNLLSAANYATEPSIIYICFIQQENFIILHLIEDSVQVKLSSCSSRDKQQSTSEIVWSKFRQLFNVYVRHLSHSFDNGHMTQFLFERLFISCSYRS